jgi:hypothetical protein
MTKGSDLFVAALENEGVDRIFGVPGEENLDVVESLRKSKIKLILTRHEQAAAFMAATHGRLTGTPGDLDARAGCFELFHRRGLCQSRCDAYGHDYRSKGDHDCQASAVSDSRRNRFNATADQDGTADYQPGVDPGDRPRRFSRRYGRAAGSCASRTARRRGSYAGPGSPSSTRRWERDR